MKDSRLRNPAPLAPKGVKASPFKDEVDSLRFGFLCLDPISSTALALPFLPPALKPQVGNGGREVEANSPEADPQASRPPETAMEEEKSKKPN